MPKRKSRCTRKCSLAWCHGAWSAASTGKKLVGHDFEKLPKGLAASQASQGQGGTCACDAMPHQFGKRLPTPAKPAASGNQETVNNSKAQTRMIQTGSIINKKAPGVLAASDRYASACLMQLFRESASQIPKAAEKTLCKQRGSKDWIDHREQPAPE